MKPLISALPLALAACAMTAPPPAGSTPPGASLVYAALSETVWVDGPKVTPLELLEDSRCPADVQCVWAGEVRIRAAIHLGSGDTVQELTMGEPVQIADGSLELVETLPANVSTSAIAPDDYRFGFRFMGGL